MDKRATIVDVARAAGVSTATVSYILNKTEGHSFTTETVQRVYDAVQQLGYIRSPSARRPRIIEKNPAPAELDRSICVAYAAITLRVQMILHGVMQTLQEAGYTVFQTPIKVDVAGQRIDPLDHYLSDRAAGIVCLGAAGWSMGATWNDVIVERRLPFVCVDCRWDRNISSVEIDYLYGACALTQNLISRGVNKIYYIQDPNQPPQTVERLRGVRRAVFESGQTVQVLVIDDPLSMDPFLTYSVEPENASDGVERIVHLLADADPNAAVLLDWADHNQFVLRACERLGLHIPIAGLERGTLSPAAFPNLCYSALPLRDMGVAAANALLRLLKDPTDITHELLVPQLIRA